MSLKSSEQEYVEYIERWKRYLLAELDMMLELQWEPSTIVNRVKIYITHLNARTYTHKDLNKIETET